uniref:PX domain-containing protein n=1 Tax=Pinguiococcus pyrenoidosus TaxID=172671 RepID=A0A7R9YDR9_9STRA|mmetsp:Transcript_4231/g.16521  ORF Transcript_4231/g.16521 Transcript_4231/m.16521 type:complete len:901 (+) Transcript_4231:258-2960(+)
MKSVHLDETAVSKSDAVALRPPSLDGFGEMSQRTPSGGGSPESSASSATSNASLSGGSDADVTFKSSSDGVRELLEEMGADERADAVVHVHHRGASYEVLISNDELHQYAIYFDIFEASGTGRLGYENAHLLLRRTGLGVSHRRAVWRLATELLRRESATKGPSTSSSTIGLDNWLILCKILALAQCDKSAATKCMSPKDIMSYSASLLKKIASAPELDAPSSIPLVDFKLDAGPDYLPYSVASSTGPAQAIQTKVSEPQVSATTPLPFTSALTRTLGTGFGLGYVTFLVTSYRVPKGAKEVEKAEATPQKMGVVRRRFSDFEWLHVLLRRRYPGLIMPSLPSKHHPLQLPLGSSEDDFTTQRMWALNSYLTQLVEHDLIAQSIELQIFLAATEHGLKLAKKVFSSIDAKCVGVTGSFVTTNGFPRGRPDEMDLDVDEDGMCSSDDLEKSIQNSMPHGDLWSASLMSSGSSAEGDPHPWSDAVYIPACEVDESAETAEVQGDVVSATSLRSLVSLVSPSHVQRGISTLEGLSTSLWGGLQKTVKIVTGNRAGATGSSVYALQQSRDANLQRMLHQLAPYWKGVRRALDETASLIQFRRQAAYELSRLGNYLEEFAKVTAASCEQSLEPSPLESAEGKAASSQTEGQKRDGIRTLFLLSRTMAETSTGVQESLDRERDEVQRRLQSEIHVHEAVQDVLEARAAATEEQLACSMRQFKQRKALAQLRALGDSTGDEPKGAQEEDGGSLQRRSSSRIRDAEAQMSKLQALMDGAAHKVACIGSTLRNELNRHDPGRKRELLAACASMAKNELQEARSNRRRWESLLEGLQVSREEVHGIQHRRSLAYSVAVPFAKGVTADRYRNPLANGHLRYNGGTGLEVAENAGEGGVTWEDDGDDVLIFS